jgi:hypothetical protein
MMLSFLMFFLALIIPVHVAFIAMIVIWPIRPLSLGSLVLTTCLAAGLAIGATSCAFFIWLLVFGSPDRGFIFLEPVFLIMISSGIWILSRTGKRTRSLEKTKEVKEKGRMEAALLVIFCIAVFSAFVVSVLMFIYKPHGTWDAWAIWNMKARILYRAGDGWQKILLSITSGRPHPDYPLLLPGTIARLWSYMKIDSLVVPAAISLIFSFGTLGLLTSSISMLRTKKQGMLAGLALLGTVYFILYGASQTADVPLGFYILSTVVLLGLYDAVDDDNKALLVLAGLMAGFAAWTKNEGMLFVISVIAARALAVLYFKGWKKALNELAAVCIGLLPVLIMVLYFKIRMAPPTDYIRAQTTAMMLKKLVDPSRYLLVVKEYIKQIAILGNGLMFILAAYLIFAGRKIDRNNLPTVVTICGALTAVLIGYFFIFVVTHNPLAWHLESLGRLLIPLWPAALFGFFLIAGGD